jgi:hypothetical protein
VTSSSAEKGPEWLKRLIEAAARPLGALELPRTAALPCRHVCHVPAQQAEPAAGEYLLFNFPPARIFMGDAGSSLLGFLAAGLSLWGSVEGIFPLWIAVLVFSPFIVDATVTLGRRLWRRERVWEAHKSHCYQRLVQLGWGHRKTVLWEYLLMMLCSISAVAALYLAPAHQWLLLVSWIFVYVILIALVSRLEGRARSHDAVESL